MKRFYLNFLALAAIIAVTTHNAAAQWSGINPVWTNSNVGIGISAPAQKFQVHNGVALLSGANFAGGPMLVFSKNPDPVIGWPNGQWGIEYEPNAQGLNFWQPFGNPGGGGSPGNFYLFLSDDKGKIGMGIDPNPCQANGNPSLPDGYRLFVKDGILTEKVKVANYCSSSWADYVFAPGYKLKPLTEVEAFIKANQHLPNVPSAQDIEKEGLDLADMLSRQMAKIEELTLYLIEMKQEIKALQDEHIALKTAISNH